MKIFLQILFLLAAVICGFLSGKKVFSTRIAPKLRSLGRKAAKGRASGRNLMKAHVRRKSVRYQSKVLYERTVLLCEREKPFLRPTLTEDELAQMLGTNRAYLSRAICLHGQCNYCTFIKRCRVQYSMDVFVKNPSLRVKDLAALCGFNTETSFNNAFKDCVGTSPGKWCKKYRDDLLE